MVPEDEINHCTESIIDELCNVDSKFDKLTDYLGLTKSSCTATGSFLD